MPRRNTAGYELTGEAQRVVDEYATSRGVSKKTIVERVMRWFASQPPAVKSVVMGHVDEGVEEAYAKALERLAVSVRQSAASGADALMGEDRDPRESRDEAIRRPSNSRSAPGSAATGGGKRR